MMREEAHLNIPILNKAALERFRSYRVSPEWVLETKFNKGSE
jgi:hypothetical protein